VGKKLFLLEDEDTDWIDERRDPVKNQKVKKLGGCSIKMDGLGVKSLSLNIYRFVIHKKVGHIYFWGYWPSVNST
jgi:hypothetical protein